MQFLDDHQTGWPGLVTLCSAPNISSIEQVSFNRGMIVFFISNSPLPQAVVRMLGRPDASSQARPYIRQDVMNTSIYPPSSYGNIRQDHPRIPRNKTTPGGSADYNLGSVRAGLPAGPISRIPSFSRIFTLHHAFAARTESHITRAAMPSHAHHIHNTPCRRFRAWKSSIMELINSS